MLNGIALLSRSASHHIEARLERATYLLAIAALMAALVFALSLARYSPSSALYPLSSNLPRAISGGLLLSALVDCALLVTRRKVEEVATAPLPQSLILTALVEPQQPYEQRIIGEGTRRTALLLVGHRMVVKGLLRVPTTELDTVYRDCLAYPISLQLGLDVVAKITYKPTSAAEPYDVRNGYILQEYIEPAPTPINIASAQEALLYQWITNRGDPIRCNSVVDARGHIYEIDNELICYGETIPHWLLDSGYNPRAQELRNAVIPPELIAKIFNQTPISIDTSGLHRSWGEHASRLGVEVDRRVKHLRQAITTLGGIEAPITCKQLLDRASLLARSK